MEGVVSVFTSKIRKLHTTRSYDYIGLTQNVQRNLKVESEVIIGVLDTGINLPAQTTNPCSIFVNYICLSNFSINIWLFQWSGIWADSPSFNDKGLGPPPAKWKGVCQKVGNFTGCNKYIYLHI